MPNGWKKNARYFNHDDMTHCEYVKKKKKFRTWKKENNIIDSMVKFDYNDINPFVSYYNTDFTIESNFTNNLTENEKSMITFYISKQLVKQSNATFKKKWSWRSGRKTTKNYNKYSRDVNRNHKVYYNDHKKMKIKPKSNYVNVEEKSVCSICCEKKNILSLFAISCKNKRIDKFKKNVDKIICNDCMSKVNSCPYCRSHKLKCVPYKLKKRIKKQRKISKDEQLRKNKMQYIKKLVSEHSTLKHQVQKQLYPDTILGKKNNKFKYFSSVKQLREKKYYPLPLKLYKYYTHWIRGESINRRGRRDAQTIFNLTTYDKVSCDIIDMYCGYNNFVYDSESDSETDTESDSETDSETDYETDYETVSVNDYGNEGLWV